MAPVIGCKEEVLAMIEKLNKTLKRGQPHSGACRKTEMQSTRLQDRDSIPQTVSERTTRQQVSVHTKLVNMLVCLAFGEVVLTERFFA